MKFGILYCNYLSALLFFLQDQRPLKVVIHAVSPLEAPAPALWQAWMDIALNEWMIQVTWDRHLAATVSVFAGHN